MNSYPENQVRAEIRRIVPGPGGAPEVLLRIRGRKYSPEDPRTFLHIKVVDRLRWVTRLRLAPGTELGAAILMTARFIEELPRPERSLDVDRRPGSGRIPSVIRVISYDARIAGEVVRHVDEEHMMLDGGIPILVRVPGPAPGLPPVGQFVAFLLHEMPVAEFL